MTRAIVIVQALTMIALGVLFIRQGQWRLGVAQFLLAVVTFVIYSGEMVK